MLEAYKEMLKNSEYNTNFTEEEDYIEYDGDKVDVVKITTSVDENGNSVVATFHKGLDYLISMDIDHKCSCHSH